MLYFSVSIRDKYSGYFFYWWWLSSLLSEDIFFLFWVIQIKSGPCETLEILSLLKYQVKHIPRDLFKLKFFCILLRCLRKKDFIIYEKTCFILGIVFKPKLFCRMNAYEADLRPSQKNLAGSLTFGLLFWTLWISHISF